MTVKEVLKELEALGDEKRKAYNTKNGAGSNQYGVPMGAIRKVGKKIKLNHDLGLKLWDAGIIEARLVAILILKPKELSMDEMDKMVKSLTFFQVADWFNSYLVKNHPNKEELRIKWLKDKNPWALRSGWNFTASKIAKGAEGLDLTKILVRIEREMGTADPIVQWTMNFALAETGIHHPSHRKRALEIGEKHGVYRDFPVSKGCTSPFAPSWINEMVSRQK